MLDPTWWYSICMIETRVMIPIPHMSCWIHWCSSWGVPYPCGGGCRFWIVWHVFTIPLPLPCKKESNIDLMGALGKAVQVEHIFRLNTSG